MWHISNENNCKRLNKNKKKKLPGLSASQKSVADFFSKTNKPILPTDTVPGVVCVDREEHSLCEKTLEKEYRLVRAARLKLPWSYDVNRLCVYKCGASSEQWGVFGQSDVEGVISVEHDVGNVCSSKLLNTSEMEKEPVPGAEGIGKYELGGEGVNSSRLRGEHRIYENPNFSSPTSKKISEKSQSVARVRKMLLSSSKKGGGGETKLMG